MKKHFKIGSELFRCEPAARARLQELKFESKQKGDERYTIELWEVSEQQDIFGNNKTVSLLVTRYTPNLFNNGIFRIHDCVDIRRSKKPYALQRYDSENHFWVNYKMGNSVEELEKYIRIHTEVR